MQYELRHEIFDWLSGAKFAQQLFNEIGSSCDRLFQRLAKTEGAHATFESVVVRLRSASVPQFRSKEQPQTA